MLRNNISSVPVLDQKDAPVTEVKIDFTPDDIEKLYRIISSDSFNKSCFYADALTLIRKKLVEYFRSVLGEVPPDRRLTDTQRKMLVSQLTMLINNKFFEGKFELKKLELFKQDILDNGKKLKTKIEVDDRDEFTSLLTRIDDECQAAVPTVNLVPDQLKTGLTRSEQSSITYGASVFHSSPGVDLCNRGLEQLKKSEWEAAAALFGQAIVAEREMAAEFKKTVNDRNILIYCANIAYSFNMAGIAFQQDERYQEAIGSYKKAIAAIHAMPNGMVTKKETALLVTYHRNLACVLNLFAIESFYAKKVEDAILYHQAALAEQGKISSESFTEDDEDSRSIYKRNLAYVLNEQGHTFYYQNDFAKALSHYQSAKAALEEIKPEHSIEEDEETHAMYQRNIEMTSAAIAREQGIQNPSAFFKRKDASPSKEATPERASKKRKLESAQSRLT